MPLLPSDELVALRTLRVWQRETKYRRFDVTEQATHCEVALVQYDEACMPEYVTEFHLFGRGETFAEAVSEAMQAYRRRTTLIRDTIPAPPPVEAVQEVG